MSTLDFENIREEISHSLRNGDILSISVRGCQTATDNFTATAGQTTFNLTHTGIRNIRSMTVDSVAKYIFRDFTFNPSTGVVTYSAGASLGDAVVIQYDYGTSGEKIYPDMPRDDIHLTSYPRVGIEMTSTRTEPLGLGGTSHLSDILMTIFIWMPANKDPNIAGGLGGTADLNDVMTSVRNIIRTNAKSYYNFPYIHPIGSTAITKSYYQKIIQISQDFQIKFIVE